MPRDTSYIRKRDGRVEKFDINRIKNAILKALQAVDRSDETLAQLCAREVVEELKSKPLNYYPEVEETQDIVETVLFKYDQYDAAKAYILYRAQHKNIRDVKNAFLDVVEILDSYVYQDDWRVRENSNSDYSFSGLLLHAAGSMVANYTLNKIYPPEIAYAHKHGDLHVHDLSMGIAGYCAGWSIRELLLSGFGGVSGKVSAKPPQHLTTALGQIVNFLGTMQNEWAGAQAFNSFDTYLAPFIRHDQLDYNSVKQAIQSFIFNLNVASRWGGQTPFTNLTFDWVVPGDLKEQPVIIGGEFKETVYSDYQEEMDIINRAFLQVMAEGDSTGRIFTFPIPTYNITEDFNWDSENAQILFEITAKYGIPYFQNFINSELNPSDVRSMCCRLQLDLRKLRNKTGGLFGSGEKTGSIGVVTINLPRIGYLARDEEDFFNRLGKAMDLAKQSLEIKRKIVQKNMDRGLFPYSKIYLGTLEHHFSTIGLVGMNEAVENFFNGQHNIVTDQGKKFSVEVLEFMRERLKNYQEETENIYNLEATPAEGTSYRLARIDKKLFNNIITAGENEPYYTNSSLLPVGYTDDVFWALQHQDSLQTKYTGGTVLHIFLGEKLESIGATRKLIEKVAHNFHLPYFTLSPTFSVCSEHGYLAGEQYQCPYCSNKTEVYSRIVGYYRPVNNWNQGKKEEFSQRQVYKIYDNKPEITAEQQKISTTSGVSAE
ncbi:MAG: anaerobic ribonucleoside-triphosphate reductase [Desulfuromonas sp. SDB]|nr:MAG: anaerobic ribonucleoside-triphosphate reductase [Desulfuromonas sp. SDB]